MSGSSERLITGRKAEEPVREGLVLHKAFDALKILNLRQSL